ncbi:hypothetical protein EW146_g6095 [Bondarzewia mesenterica]|uniref:Uncharacterized protein n=1 Tax=Bondarzewia mesenterica TaxID=1095465 RepID=A0A4S4LQL4_9AGAM|nr:hypothetical protein EW146_g6095 [Bondarzewia mesenterica]
MADISNNPFIDTSSSAASRYPNLSTQNSGSPQPSAPYTSWIRSPTSPSSGSYTNTGVPNGYINSNPTGYAAAQPGYQQQQWGGQQAGYGAQTPASSQYAGSSGFTPSSSFGQQLVSQATGYPQQQSYSGMPQQQGYGGYPSQTGYPQQQQQQQQQPQQPYGGNSYLAQFDPYSNNNNGMTSPTSQVPNSYAGSGAGGNGNGNYQSPHPRTFIHTHKAELELWDGPTWKQALNTFEELKRAWEERKRAAEIRVRALGGVVGGASGFFGGQPGYGSVYGYGQQQEMERLNAVVKEAEANVDTVAASAFQMTEVSTGYRHSGDLASKRRVRESSNAAIANLPDWPPQAF